MNGQVAEGARCECRRSEGVQRCAQSNAHAAVQGRKRADVFRGPREGSKE